MRYSKIFAASLIVAGQALGGPHAAYAEAPMRVAIYRGPAACEDCSETVERALAAISGKYAVEFIGPNEDLDISAAALEGIELYVQPAGGQDIEGALDSLGEDGQAAIRAFVAGGGKYLGLCMGAYLADTDNLGLVPFAMESEVGRVRFPVTTIEDAAIEVLWSGKQDWVFYQDGPYLTAVESHPAFFAIGSYLNGDLAAARFGYGDGLVVLSGPHPEADRSWYEEAELDLEKMPSRNLFEELMAAFDRP
jgi:glutamine amidotransferase-like uncharacterized protein